MMRQIDPHVLRNLIIVKANADGVINHSSYQIGIRLAAPVAAILPFREAVGEGHPHEKVWSNR